MFCVIVRRNRPPISTSKLQHVTTISVCLTNLLFLNSVHVVFGRVVGGIDVVRQIEALPVDANSRPLQDVRVARCGELVRQIKGNY